jgi:hypothetical protein
MLPDAVLMRPVCVLMLYAAVTILSLCCPHAVLLLFVCSAHLVAVLSLKSRVTVFGDMRKHTHTHTYTHTHTHTNTVLYTRGHHDVPRVRHVLQGEQMPVHHLLAYAYHSCLPLSPTTLACHSRLPLLPDPLNTKHTTQSAFRIRVARALHTVQPIFLKVHTIFKIWNGKVPFTHQSCA